MELLIIYKYFKILTAPAGPLITFVCGNWLKFSAQKDSITVIKFDKCLPGDAWDVTRLLSLLSWDCFTAYPKLKLYSLF